MIDTGFRQYLLYQLYTGVASEVGEFKKLQYFLAEKTLGKVVPINLLFIQRCLHLQYKRDTPAPVNMHLMQGN
jgi:hypothetical protein